MSESLVYLSATELTERYRTKSLSPVEVTNAVFDRIDKVGGPINAFVMTDRDAALAVAARSEARWRAGEPIGLVDGVPTTIKDLILTQGWPTLRGSLATDPDQPWDEDAPCVARLKEHGAIIIGKTTTPEFGHKGVTDSRLSGITRNPWNHDKTPGGSSGGASAAVAAGMGPLAIGTDGGGSVRIPASFAGIYGIKATFGRVPAHPLSPFGTVAHVGPMTRTVADAACMLTVISGPDWRDWHALPYDGEDFRAQLDAGVAGMRVAYSPALGLEGVAVDPEVARLVEAAARQFEALGAHVEQVDPHWPHDPGAVFMVYWSIGAAKLLAAFSDAQKAEIDQTLHTFAETGAAYDGLTVKTAEMNRGALGFSMNRFFQDFDLLLSPTMPMPAFDAGQPWPSADFADEPLSWTPFTYPINLTRHPAASINCGFTETGLPVGLQIVGPMFGDAAVLRASRAYEQANPLYKDVPEL